MLYSYCYVFSFFFFNESATTGIYTYLHTLSLHDALPISSSTPSGAASLPEAASEPVARAIMPATKLPVSEAKNQQPMIRLAMCEGASRFIADRPTGDRHSSPIVCSR